MTSSAPAGQAGRNSKGRGVSMKFNAAKLLIACAVVLGFAGAAQAESVTITPAVQQNCQWDYDNFCKEYGIGSELLDMCFKSNGAKLSKACVDALIAAGDTSQEYVDQQKKLLGRQGGG